MDWSWIFKAIRGNNDSIGDNDEKIPTPVEGIGILTNFVLLQGSNIFNNGLNLKTGVTLPL